MMINLVVMGLLFILSVVLLAGKGSWLIAGYNTSSRERKEKYNKEKLCWAAGVMVLIEAIDMALITFFRIHFMVFSLIMLVSVIAAIVYMNKCCLKSVSGDEKPDIDTGKGFWPNNKPKSMIIGIGLVIVIGVITAIFMVNSGKPPVYSLNNGILDISTEFGQKIDLADIKSIQMKNELPAGLNKVNSLGLGTVLKGKFTSDSGDVTVYADSSKPPFIYIATPSGLIILNDQSPAKTRTLFDKINSAVNKQSRAEEKPSDEITSQQAPVIKEIRFEDLDGKAVKENANWFELGSKVKIVVVLEGDCQEVDLFITPTGSAVYKEQRLIEIVTPQHNIAEYIWDVPKDTMGHFNIIAYNCNVGRRSDLYCVVSGQ